MSNIHKKESTSRDGLTKTTKCKFKYLKKIDGHPHQEDKDEDYCGDLSDSYIDLDTLRSGESLFKTFNFNPDQNTDMKKCISFWNKILEQKLQPIKVSLLEKANKAVEVKQEDSHTLSASSSESNEDEKNLWIETFKIIQQRKFQEMRKMQICQEQEEMNSDNKRFAKKMTTKKQIKSSPKYNTPRNNAGSANVNKSTDTKTLKTSTINLKDRQQKSTNNIKIKRFKKVEKRKYSEELIWDFPTEIEPLPTLDVGKTEPDNCCKCGCKSDVCECDKLDQIFSEIISQKVAEIVQERTYSNCGCDSDCICEEVTKPLPCKCGCNLNECVCQNTELLRPAPKNCTCGCGFDTCICQQGELLLDDVCDCGNKDCKCDEIAILKAQIEEFEATKKRREDARKSGDNESIAAFQGRNARVEAKWPMEISANAITGKYCNICGLFHCACNVQN